MALLAPLFLLGLAAVAVPVVLHLSQRARKEPVRFPSLAFVRRVPFKTTERRRLRDLLLFALRVAALGLLVVAFARPFFERGMVGASGATIARDVVVLLDASGSMRYGDRWDRARAAVRRVVRGLGPDDRATLVLFDATPRVMGPPTGDPVQLEAYLADTRPGDGTTRYAPALDLAHDLVAESSLPRRAVVLITDFQRAGWDGRTDLQLPAGTTFEPVDVGDETVENAAVADVALQRSPENGGRVTVTARVANLGTTEIETRVRLGTGEQTLHEMPIRVPVGETSIAQFPDIALPLTPTPAWVALPGDALPTDDQRRFVLRPIPRIAVLLVEPRGGSEREALFIRRALAIGRDPALVATVRTAPSAADVGAADVVILNDAPFPSGEVGQALMRLLERGGGLLWALGPRAGSIPERARAALGTITGAPVDRLSTRGGVVGIADYGHPIFAPYRGARGADYGAVRVFRYRRLMPPDSSRVLAWTDDGAPILTEARVGRGHALLWSSDFGNVWSDLAVRAVFLPTIHEAVRYLAGHREAPSSYTVGQVLAPEEIPSDSIELVLEAPDGARTPMPAGRPEPIPLAAAGLYTIRPLAGGTGTPVAVNTDPAESDLTPLDPMVLAAGVAPPPDDGEVVPSNPTMSAAERERRQRLWWYVALAALVVLAGESIFAGVRPRGIGA